MYMPTQDRQRFQILATRLDTIESGLRALDSMGPPSHPGRGALPPVIRQWVKRWLAWERSLKLASQSYESLHGEMVSLLRPIALLDEPAGLPSSEEASRRP